MGGVKVQETYVCRRCGITKTFNHANKTRTCKDCKEVETRIARLLAGKEID